MTTPAPRLRLFAGPNGSGKSTIKELLPSEWLGVYVNADDIEKKLRQEGMISLSDYEVDPSQQDWETFVSSSTWLAKEGLATEDPDINIDRVRHRVAMGGHTVPADKIKNRYAGSLALLSDAVANTDRAYIFDNSGAERVWIAEITDGQELVMRTDSMPAWFKTALWDKFEDAP